MELAHIFGMETIAEGVETEGQAALLEAMGCDMVQGCPFSEPLAAKGTAKRTARRTARRTANLLDAIYHRNPRADGDVRLRTVGPRTPPEKLHARTVANWLPGY